MLKAAIADKGTSAKKNRDSYCIAGLNDIY
ncbi:hypothetical protein DFP98_109229 [Cohnella phaseoli]|uniref:Uncharacterized protein n=1 Tax=Cohnella phaseoli TaxID=456490 RepID=A0A3D9JU92_9BACL|nr:hypothetical protein DFP98_109229 [Cohnella phaseoli]